MIGVDALARERIARWPRDLGLLYPAFKELSLDIATRIFMASDLGADAHRLSEAFVDTIHAAYAIVRRPVPFGRWRAGLRGRALLEEFFRRELPKKRDKGGDDLFSALCQATSEEGERFSDDDVVSHMIFLMMAAHDTSTITASAVAYHLARYPAWQGRVWEQIRALGDRPLDADALDQLTELELVIKESLRLVAPVHSLARKTVRDTDILGHFVPKDTHVAVATWSSHYEDAYWTNPEAFDPDRFAEPRREDKIHRYAWLSFGGGAHKCIGLSFGVYEVKTLVANLLRRYRLSVPDGYELRWEMLGLPVPADGLPVELHPR
jgi:cytochrome P450